MVATSNWKGSPCTNGRRTWGERSRRRAMTRSARRRRWAGGSAGGNVGFLVPDRTGMGRWCIHRAPCPLLIGSFHPVVVVDPAPLPVGPGAPTGVSRVLNDAPNRTVGGALSSGPDQRRQACHVRRRHRGTGQGVIPRVVPVPVAQEAPVEVVLNGGENAHAGRSHVNPVRPVARERRLGVGGVSRGDGDTVRVGCRVGPRR